MQLTPESEDVGASRAAGRQPTPTRKHRSTLAYPTRNLHTAGFTSYTVRWVHMRNKRVSGRPPAIRTRERLVPPSASITGRAVLYCLVAEEAHRWPFFRVWVSVVGLVMVSPGARCLDGCGGSSDL